MVCFRKVVLAAVASGILSLVSAVNAEEIYNNLAVTSLGMDPVGVDGPSYNSFSTGNTASVLTDIKLLLAGIPTTPDTPQFTVSLLSDSSHSPGSVLTTFGPFDDSTLPTTASPYNVPVTSYALAANTRYWIELSTTTSNPVSSVQWNYASNATGVGVSGEYWAYTPGGVLTVYANSDVPNPFQMSVTTSSAVPEPGTLCQALSALGIGVFVMARRRMVRE